MDRCGARWCLGWFKWSTPSLSNLFVASPRWRLQRLERFPLSFRCSILRLSSGDQQLARHLLCKLLDTVPTLPLSWLVLDFWGCLVLDVQFVSLSLKQLLVPYLILPQVLVTHRNAFKVEL